MHGCNIVNNGRYAFNTAACSDPGTVIDAENNWWGVDDSAEIEALVYHRPDQPSAPLIDYVPFAPDSLHYDCTTGVFDAPAEIVPSGFTLHQNYPNPFNRGTVIVFALDRPSHVQLGVYNALGQHVREVTSEYYSSIGPHGVSFDGNGRDGRALPSGVYIYRLTAGGVSQSRKMVVLR